MREVDELEHAIDHGVAQGHQRVDAAHGKAVQKLLKKLFHVSVMRPTAQFAGGVHCPPPRFG